MVIANISGALDVGKIDEIIDLDLWWWERWFVVFKSLLEENEWLDVRFFYYDYCSVYGWFVIAGIVKDY